MSTCSDIWAETARNLDETLKQIYRIRSGFKGGERGTYDQKINLARSAVLGKLESSIHNRLVICQAVLGHVEAT